MKRFISLLSAALISASLAACSSDGLDDLREFVKNAHADKKPRVEPLPDIKMQETFIYNAANLTDPFAAFNLMPQGLKSASGPRPDPKRRKEPLEDYPLDSLKMVGTLMRGKQAWAVIQAPDGTVHRAQVGDHLGQNSGMIHKISDEKVDLIELIQGTLGDWIEREANLSLLQ
ncbi:MAG: pilus assembly protein PilP [Gammaproteobacteria bacterium]|nr:pilus assembly protein PilP [Gammaproteobacteria bacterium]MDH3406177.1 pilus assembly protein PilP [Gammaproteobacteria bacterium]MDH5485949.1 pilus assembly protein PilP [Gammaproteobacteria bacterium]